MMTSLVIFDVDDTLCPDGKWAPYPLAGMAIRELQDRGIVCAAASNAGYWGARVGEEAARQRVLAVTTACGIPSELVRICLHLKTAGCACRKPKPGMLDELIWFVSGSITAPPLTWMVGDRWEDIAAGVRAAARTVLVGMHNFPYPQKGTTLLDPSTPNPDFIVVDIMHGAQLIAGISSL